MLLLFGSPGGTPRTLTAAAGSFALAGNAAGLAAGRRLTCAAGTFVETGNAATFLVARILACHTGTFVETGLDAGLSYSGVTSFTLTAATGTFAETGIAAGLRYGHRLTAATGTFTETGIAASLLAGRRLTAATGAFTETGRAATLTYSGAITSTFTKAATATVVLTAAANLLKVRFSQAYATVAIRATADSRMLLAGETGGLVDVLRTGLAKRFPLDFAEVPGGIVLMTNGVDPMLRWDGTARAAEVAGVPAPADACTMKFTNWRIDYTTVTTTSWADNQETITSKTTLTLNQFSAYVRFLDRYGNVSDFSPIADGLGYFQSGGVFYLQGVPVSREEFLAHEATLGIVEPIPGVTAILQTTYENVPVPTGPYAAKVYRRQVLRNTAGQATTWFVDLDTTDLTSTTLVSNNTDDDIKGNEAVPFLDDLGNANANTHGFPPSWKAAVVAHLGRAFAAAEVVYDEGHADVTGGSATVQGVDTEWPVELVGRRFYVPGAPASYEIAAVDPVAQTLTLADAFQGATSVFAPYAIRPAPAERRLVYYTPAGEPESWPPTYALEVVEDGDEITGLMTLSSFLYILEGRHVYRFTFKDDPAVDGAVFLTSLRGCLSQRLWVQVDDSAYMLDEQGVHLFEGGQSTPVSAPIQDLFRDDTPSPLRINWQADHRLWHAAYSEVHATVRFFVAMTGTRFPRHAICYNTRDDRWWIEEYLRPVTSSCRANIGIARVLAGVDHREMIALNVGWVDGAKDPRGTLRGTVTGTTATTLHDVGANFVAEDSNLAVYVTSGRGKGQWRRIVSVLSTRLELLTPWLITPAVGDSYAVGGIGWQWRGGWFRFTDNTEGDNARDVEMIHQPNAAGAMDLYLRYNHGVDPRVWSTDRGGAAAVTAGRDDVVVDLTNPSGRAIHRLEGHLERYADGDRYVSAELAGVQVAEPVRVYRVTMNGVELEG